MKKGVRVLSTPSFHIDRSKVSKLRLHIFTRFYPTVFRITGVSDDFIYLSPYTPPLLWLMGTTSDGFSLVDCVEFTHLLVGVIKLLKSLPLSRKEVGKVEVLS